MESGFAVYDNLVKEGKVARAIVVDGIAEKPRSFFDKMNDYAKEADMGGMVLECCFCKRRCKRYCKTSF